jgi:hypothetical protein
MFEFYRKLLEGKMASVEKLQRFCLATIFDQPEIRAT